MRDELDSQTREFVYNHLHGGSPTVEKEMAETKKALEFTVVESVTVGNALAMLVASLVRANNKEPSDQIKKIRMDQIALASALRARVLTAA